MKFAGYVNRESILRLKCDKELNNMLKYVADREALVSDKKEMFGILAADLKLLSILPGLSPHLNVSYQK